MGAENKRHITAELYRNTEGSNAREAQQQQHQQGAILQGYISHDVAAGKHINLYCLYSQPISRLLGFGLGGTPHLFAPSI